MARGFERNGKKGAGRFNYANDFKRDILRATKKAGREVGKLIVKDRKEALIADAKSRDQGKNYTWKGASLKPRDGPSRRRLSAVRSIVGRDGTLIALDHAPMAVLQETGGVIKSKGKKLRIGREQTPGRNTFVTKGGLVMEVGTYIKRLRNKDGTFKQNYPKTPPARIIAILLDEVVIRRLPENARLETIANRRLPLYLDLIEKYLVE
jgi:hypothetical protein